MKRIILALMLVIMCSGTALSREYPAIGMCTANYVRYRDEPGTDSNILGRIHEYNDVIVLGEKRHNGEKWYRIENPADEGEAWVSGKYIDIYEFDNVPKSVYAVKVKMMQTFGINPEKARVLLGKPERTKTEKFYFEPANENLKGETLQYDGCELYYVEGSIRSIKVTNSNYGFGDIYVGDSKQMVIDTMGKPESENEDSLSYSVTDLESIEFTFSDDKIISMTFEHYMD
ncbi:MAG: SH3 domain-containing protein [Synergistaceae bacterium]|nr:SH3 domain-containing protein [Synergistaceae bacterium]MBQ6111396.1 SH3 domain-containing protein [Synergistaceae bacterium]